MAARVKVWDIYIRFYHWALVVLVFANFFFTEEGEQPHNIVGYAAVALVLVRFIWGLFTKSHARIGELFPSPQKVKDYALAMLQGRAPRSLGHNPLAALMMLTMLMLILLLGLSGWLMVTDMFSLSDFLLDVFEETHEALANILMFCVGLHATAAIIDSLRHRENLVMSMLHGYKRE